MNVYKNILCKRSEGRKMLAVLLDPDKCTSAVLTDLYPYLREAEPDFIFVGGSVVNQSVNSFVLALKSHVKSPVVLFPGSATQFSSHADALLYLSLLSGRNPEYLIGQHVTSSLRIKKSGIETIPMGYILVDGGTVSSVQQASRTTPIPHQQTALIVSTAVAGEMLGFRLVYLEAGSGARWPVSDTIIQAVRSELSLPLLVGGGICTIEQMEKTFKAGADLVVVGNHFEKSPADIPLFCTFAHHFTI